MTVLTLLFMILLHIYEDFHLQGKMANMKQKTWWLHEVQDTVIDTDRRMGVQTDVRDPRYIGFVDWKMSKYGGDYIPVLFLHGFEWAMFIHIPIMVSYILYTNVFLSDMFLTLLCASIILNMLIHVVVDHEKANRMSINLIADQLIHLIQIMATFILFWVVL